MLNKRKLNDQSKRTVTIAVMVTVGMFGFGFALVPLYDVLCDLAGLNGKTGPKYVLQSGELETDVSRQVKVQFITSNNESMSWHFKPEVTQVAVHPGELMQVDFLVSNPTQQKMLAQAVPSLSPSEGADYFHKVECFCFTQQVLEPGEEARMPLRFVIDNDLPKHLTKLTLSYTLFDLTNTNSEITVIPAKAGIHDSKPDQNTGSPPSRG